MWTFIVGIIQKVLSFFPSAPTPEAQAETVGESAGTAKQQAATSQAVLTEVKTADAVRQQTEAAQVPGVMPRDDGFERN